MTIKGPVLQCHEEDANGAVYAIKMEAPDTWGHQGIYSASEIFFRYWSMLPGLK